MMSKKVQYLHYLINKKSLTGKRVQYLYYLIDKKCICEIIYICLYTFKPRHSY